VHIWFIGRANVLKLRRNRIHNKKTKIMIGILIISHENLADSLVQCATHVLGEKLQQVKYLSVFAHDNPDDVVLKARKLVSQIDAGDGVLVLSDIYGATPSNIARQLIKLGRVECLVGVNLPMLIRALTYRNEPLVVMIEKAVNGGKDGIFHVRLEPCDAV
jgi:mannose PTS system EIIA component